MNTVFFSVKKQELKVNVNLLKDVATEGSIVAENTSTEMLANAFKLLREKEMCEKNLIAHN